jgi:hypothetical protein
LCRGLTEKLLLAGKRKDYAERAQAATINELTCQLQDVTRGLEQTKARIIAAEAQAAEMRLRKANQELAAVEEAIRERLL